MSKRIALLLLAVTACTAAVYAALLVLGGSRVDPIVWVPSRLPEFRQHGMPTLSIRGLAIWVAVLAFYASGTVLLSASIIRVWSAKRLMLSSVLVFLGAAAVVALVHPTLLLTVLSPDARLAYSKFVIDNVAFLDHIYFRWGLLRLKYFIVLAQVLITLAALAPVVTAFKRSDMR